MFYKNLALLAALAYLYSLASGRLECTPVSGAIVFTGFGVIFGPHGLATIVFGVIVLNEQLPGGDTLTTTVVATVVLSILAHG